MEDQFMQEIRKIFLEQAERQGRIEDVDSFMEEFDKIFKPKDYFKDGDYNGFSEQQMFQMTYLPFGPDGPVQFRHLTEEEIAQIPFMHATLHLMNALNQKEIKLTPKGSLPIKMVTELYELGSKSLRSDWYQRKTEECSFEVQILRGVLKELGLIKVRTGKMSLTARGKKLLATDHNVLLQTIILFFFTEYNTGWLDNQGAFDIGNIGRIYSLWLLYHFGNVWRPMQFYQEEYFKAFPTLIEENTELNNLYKSRVFPRLFVIIGLCEINDGEEFIGENRMEEVRKTPILDMMFSFKEPAKI